MGDLLLGIIRWIFNKLIIFVFILVLVVGFNSIRYEYDDYKRKEGQIVILKKDIKNAKDVLDTLKEKLDEETKNKLEQLNKQILRVKNEIQLKEDLLSLLPYILSRIPGTDAYSDRLVYILEIETLKITLDAILDAINKLKTVNDEDIVALTEVIASKKEELDKIRKISAGSLPHKIFKSVREQVVPALIILIGIIMVPTGIKILLYYIVAPLVERRPGIQLLPDTSDAIITRNNNKGNISSVSTAIKLEKDEELSIRSEYIQDLPRHNSKKSTQYFINNHLPFSSISTGLFVLSLITTEHSEAITVSATKNPFMEVGIINIPEGSPLVCHPRSLVGVIHKSREQIHITKHWRLFSLQAWLTLQLRFLVIHGPCKLIVNGCRGVRIEVATEARMINQSATLGFSPNLNYKNTRCETFISYWLGKQDLFNDLFHGDHGIYVYEEMPDQNRKGIGGVLDRIIDTALRIFGL